MCEHNQKPYNCIDCQEKKEQRDREEAIANGARYQSTLRDDPGYFPGDGGGLIGFIIQLIVELCCAIKDRTKGK